MSSSSPAPESWISSFCSLLGHEYFAEVSEDFIEDDFNLTGLQSLVPMYKEALEMILDVEPEEDEDDEEEEEEEDDDDDLVLGDERGGYRRSGERRHMRDASDLSLIESSAEMLYGLIHQRYITSRPGIQQMTEKYELQNFGVCPRVACNGCRVLPVGHSDTPGMDTVKLFCPSCQDIYTPPNSRFQSVDGAFFGTTFGCLFFMTFPELDVGARADGLNIAPLIENNTTTTAAANNSVVSTTSTLSPLDTNKPGAGASAGGSGSSASSATLPPQPTMINGVATSNLAPGLGPGKIYEPKIYGFRVSERARSGPRMRWLRSKPTDINELDEVRIFHQMQEDDEDDELGDEEIDDDEDEEDEEDSEVDDEDDEELGDGAMVQDRPDPATQSQMQLGTELGAARAGIRKKKSTARRRGGGGSPMDTNGLGDAV
ncbi:MAG: casein kinase 2 regulatory subunit [Chaenotheca gracillima]|nr:MAG: casein kinase 2 regulatory subunit [Chaenotheca gracillima]